MLAQAVIEANKLGKNTQVSAVLEEFAEKKAAANDYIRVGKEKSKAAYWKAIQRLQSITLGPIHYDSDDDLYDNYFIKKVIPIPADGYHILDFPDRYVESEFFFKCFQPEGEMHSLILDFKCYLLNKNWKDRVILCQKTMVSSIIALQYDFIFKFSLIFLFVLEMPEGRNTNKLPRNQ